MIALSILETCIKTRWKILAPNSKKGIKGFVESLVVKLAQDGNLGEMGPFLTKLNTVLIEIIKREWPHNWPGFVSQVVEVSKKSEIVCANNMNLLRLLSEEAFENESLHLSHQQVDSFKENLTKFSLFDIIYPCTNLYLFSYRGSLHSINTYMFIYLYIGNYQKYLNFACLF